jgi:hypothetical protein
MTASKMTLIETFEIHPFTFSINETTSKYSLFKVEIEFNNKPPIKNKDDKGRYLSAYHSLIRPFAYNDIGHARRAILKFLEHWSNI